MGRGRRAWGRPGRSVDVSMVARRKPSDGCGKTTRPLRPPLPFLSRKEIQTGFVHLFETNMVRSRPPARHFINQRGPPYSPRPAGCPARIGSPGAPSPPRAATCPSAAPNPAAGSVWPSSRARSPGPPGHGLSQRRHQRHVTPRSSSATFAAVFTPLSHGMSLALSTG